MNSNVPRKHHYVPVFYLANFTPSGDKDDPLYVHDMERRETRRMSPRNIANQKDYNTLQVEGTLSEFFEGPAATVIRKVIKSEELPMGKDFEILMMFLLTLAVRVPIVREYEARADARSIWNHLRYLAETDPAELDARVESLRDAGIKLPDNMSSEALKAMSWNEVTIKLPVEWHMYNMMDLLSVERRLLTDRRWILNVSDKGDFICSDKPVIAHPLMTKNFDQSRFVRPDFKRDTVIVMPISRRISLTGDFSGAEGGTAEADARRVALLNGFLVAPTQFTTHDEGRHVMRYIYSPTEDFGWWTPQERIGNIDDLFASLPTK